MSVEAWQGVMKVRTGGQKGREDVEDTSAGSSMGPRREMWQRNVG